VFDLKREIILNKKLGKGPEFDIALDDAQTGEEYADDNFQIPKNTSVIVRLLPATPYRSAQRYLSGSSFVPRGSQLAAAKLMAQQPSLATLSSAAAANPSAAAMASTTTIQGETEADKIQSLFQQSDDQWKKESLQIAMYKIVLILNSAAKLFKCLFT
jgi:protein MPE1